MIITNIKRIPAVQDEFWGNSRYGSDDLIVLYDKLGEIARIPTNWPNQPVAPDGKEVLATSLKVGDEILAPGQDLYSAREICRFLYLTPSEFAECLKSIPMTKISSDHRVVRFYDLGTFCNCHRWIKQRRSELLFD